MTNRTSAALGDLNDDGHLDILATMAYSTAPSVAVLLGVGDGTFEPEVRYDVGSDARAIVTGDFDEDGALDAAVAYAHNGGMTVLLGTGDGTFASLAGTTSATSRQASPPAI